MVNQSTVAVICSKGEIIVTSGGVGKMVCLLNLGVKDSLCKDLLGNLGTHVSIPRLTGNEHTSNFTLLSIHLVHFHFNSSTSNLESLVILLEELGITLLTGLKTGQGHGHIVTGGSSTSLGVEEETGTVGWDAEVTTHLEAGLEGSAVSGGDELFDGEEEGDALSSWQLDRGGSIVNTLFFGEDDLSTVGLQAALDALKGVSLTSHDFGVDKLLLSLSGLADLFLDSPGLGLDAHVYEAGSGLGSDGILANDLRTAVGQSGALHLEVGELVEFGFGDGLGRGGGDAEDCGGGEGGGSDFCDV